MSEWLRREWQRLGGGALVLLPLTLAFMAIVAWRRFLYRHRLLPVWHSPVPVVVVGNITVGGAGKTPLTMHVVDLLLHHGWTPGVVARGYGRVPPREADPLGVVRVYPDVATPEHFGDEPVMIARRSRVPVYISVDRPAAARALLEAHREVDVIVSDDGLQHYALGRDVELAVVDGETRFGNGLLMPSGPLREPRSRLATVDAVVVNGGHSDERLGARQFGMTFGRERFASLTTNQELSAEEFARQCQGRAVAAIAGIGHPQRFFDHLQGLGIAARAHAFPDHHHYQPRDLRLPGAEVVVMTEKDAVKCGAFADARMWMMRVEAMLPAEFDEFLLNRLRDARRKAHGPQAA